MKGSTASARLVRGAVSTTTAAPHNFGMESMMKSIAVPLGPVFAVICAFAQDALAATEQTPDSYAKPGIASGGKGLLILACLVTD